MEAIGMGPRDNLQLELIDLQSDVDATLTPFNVRA